MTFALVVSAMLLAPHPFHSRVDDGGRVAVVRVADGVQADLQKKLMDKFHAMNAKREGIFHEDISPTVAPYFPVGQPIAETKKIVADQHLGELMPFKGKPMADEHAPFATKFHVMGAQYSQVEVIIHFDFDGDTESDYKLKSVHAYMRGTSM